MDNTVLCVLCAMLVTCYVTLTAAQPNLAALLGGLNVDRGFVPSWGVDTGFDSSSSGGGGGGGGGSCPYMPHPDRFKFTQEVNQRTVTQSCAPGTMYDHSVCSCVNTPKGASPGAPMPGSNPRLQMPMQGPAAGTSAFIGSMMAQLQGGSNSGLQLPPTSGALPAPMKPVSRSTNNQMERFRQMMANSPSPLPGVQPLNNPAATLSSPIQPQPSSSVDLLSPIVSQPVNDPQPSGGIGSFPPELLAMIERAQRPPKRPESSSGRRPVPPLRRSEPNQTPLQSSQKTPHNAGFSLNHHLQQQSGFGPMKAVSEPNPVANIMAQLSAAKPPSGPRSDPFAALLGQGSSNSWGGSGRPSNTGSSIASLFGGSATPSGGSGGLEALLGLGNLGSSTGGSSGAGGMSAMMNDPRIAQLLGGSSAASLATGTLPGQSTPDLTSLFNMQGRLGMGGGIAGLNNINIAKLEQLDRQGLIDLSDLTPAGLAAANAHFSGMSF